MLRLLSYLFDLVAAVVLGRVLNRALQQVFGGPQTPRAPTGPARPETRGGEMARDPVCGMFVSTQLSHRLNEGGRTFHFCSDECLKRYRESGNQRSATAG